MQPDATAAEIIDRARITYRQLDFWVSNGYLRPRRQATHPGSGNTRTFTPHEAEVAEVMGELVALGVAAAPAARLARRLVTRGSASTETLRIERVA